MHGTIQAILGFIFRLSFDHFFSISCNKQGLALLSLRLSLRTKRRMCPDEGTLQLPHVVARPSFGSCALSEACCMVTECLFIAHNTRLLR